MSRQNRKRNINVSGLVSHKNISDTILVEKLREAEFEVHTEIVRTRRLGQRIPDRLQPLVVSFFDVAISTHLLDNAKCLHRSCNAYTLKAIYFNPDMTKTESQAAYEQRSKRRLQKSRTFTTSQLRSGTRSYLNTQNLNSGRDNLMSYHPTNHSMSD